MSQAEAEAAIVAAQHILGTVTQGTSATVPAGRVMGQDPGAGLYVAKGTPVNLVISTGPAKVIVPDLVRHTKAEAQTLIAAFSLTLGTVSYVYHDSIAFDYVISHSPQTGASVAPGSKVDLVISFGPEGGLPPDPSTIAPPLDSTVATILSQATEFLYTGPASIQTGVASGIIEARRTAVLRGKVLDRDGQPMPGVTITILNHPEFGQTVSREDGMFDMAVNGGGLLAVNYQKNGYLQAQRQVKVPWQDYTRLPDVLLVSHDTQVTPIDFSEPFQVAKGSTISDSDGTRQANMLFPQGTAVHMVMSDGSMQTVDRINVRATEYSVGPNGFKAMPAMLPSASGYINCLIIIWTLCSILCGFRMIVGANALRSFLNKTQMTDHCAMKLFLVRYNLLPNRIVFQIIPDPFIRI